MLKQLLYALNICILGCAFFSYTGGQAQSAPSYYYAFENQRNLTEVAGKACATFCLRNSGKIISLNYNDFKMKTKPLTFAKLIAFLIL